MKQFLLFLVFFASGAFAQNPKSEGIAECIRRDEFQVSDSTQEIESFFSWIQKLTVTDSVDFYAQLTANSDYSEFKRGTMQMVHSRSAQKQATSPEHPRLIAYHPMGIFLGLVDPADPKLAEYKYSFEGIQYNFVRDEWEPFKGHISENQLTINKTQAATSTCFRCHGDTFRPIWRSYRAWPGQLSSSPIHSQSRFNSYLGNGYGDPGQMLMMYLNRLNYRRMHARLKENPNWKNYRAATVGALLGCENIPEFFGPKTRAILDGHDGKRFSELRIEVEKTINENHDIEKEFAEYIGDEMALRELHPYNELQDAVRMASLRYMFELSGTDVKSFGMSRPPGRNSVGYGFNQVGTSSGGVHNFLCQVLPEYYEKGGTAKAPLEWSPYGSISYNGKLEEACKELQTESLEINP